MALRLGIDTGGTFTDVVAVDDGTGAIIATKTPSTPLDPAVGFMAAVAAAREHEHQMAIFHGTTVATNMLLQDDLGTLGFVTTEGFEFVLEIARQSVPDGYGNSYFWVKPPRIAPVRLVRTVPGRLDHTGDEIRPFETGVATEVARWFRSQGVDTIGVCLLHAYANPAHEHAMREVLRREHPDAVVSLSSDVLPEYREYERSVTTLVDAAVKPRVGRYVAGIQAGLQAGPQAGIKPDIQAGPLPGANERIGAARFSIMQSNGGILSADEVVGKPIMTVLSGPAAGVLAAAYVAEAAGYDAIVTLDGGGTSSDVSVVIGGRPTITTEGRVGRHPIKVPMVDVVTVGAGGGSAAWVSPEGTLKVGPRSAGADPGPLCYGKGGVEPTVTDAAVHLGWLPPRLLGGQLPLDAQAASTGMSALGSRLDLSADAAAAGVLEIFAWNQANAIRQITVKRGLDVRDFVAATFGGSGSLLACRLIDILGLQAVLVPRDPGTLSAFGLLTVDVRLDYVRTVVRSAGGVDLPAFAGVYAELEALAAAALDRESFARADHRYARSADLRYAGQAFELRVDAPGGAVDEAFAAHVVAEFHDAHERLYGYCYRDDRDRHPVEWVNVRVTGIGPMKRPPVPELPRLAAADGDLSRARTGRRPVRFAEWAQTPVFGRDQLARSDVVIGPAVIEEFGSTVPVEPGFTVRVDAHGNLVIARRDPDHSVGAEP